MHGTNIGDVVADDVRKQLIQRYAVYGGAAALRDAAVFHLYLEDLCGASEALANEPPEWMGCARDVAATLLPRRAQMVLGPFVQVQDVEGTTFILRDVRGGPPFATFKGSSPMTTADEVDTFLGRRVAECTAAFLTPSDIA